jgi:predicted ATPase
MLHSVEISNFKSIADCHVFLRQENVIVGKNGSGKSNFIDAIYFLCEAVNDNLDTAITKRHGINSIRRWSKTRPYNIAIKLGFINQNQHGEYRVVISSSAGNFSVIEEEGYWYGPTPFRSDDDSKLNISSFKRIGDNAPVFNIPKNPFSEIEPPKVQQNELIMSQFGQNRFSPMTFFFGNLHTEITSFSKYAIYPNVVRIPQSISTAEVLNDDGSNMASIIKQMHGAAGKRNKDSLNAAIRQVMPIVEEIRIESAGGFYVPVVRVLENENGYRHDLNLSQISDGTLRMMGILTAFYQTAAPYRIALEEPEQMIHPGLLQVLVEASRDYILSTTTHQNQMLITTHSPSLLDLYRPEDIFTVSFDSGISSVARVSQRQLDIMKRNLFSPGELLVTEGLLST